jgi:signal transduction histidine kinase/ligand-binding sensor domain-containing protein
MSLNELGVTKLYVQLALSTALLIATGDFVPAERLPIKTYTTADGLAHNNVQRIDRDSRGFLWFCTFEGLSRFDGYGFTSFGVDQGLPSPVVNDLLETRDGRYWIATDGGLCQFNPKGVPHRTSQQAAGDAPEHEAMFTSYYPGPSSRARLATSLLEDRSGVIWCGTAGGLFRLDLEGGGVTFQLIDLGMPAGNEDYKHINSIIEDRLGALWIASNSGIYRLRPDGTTERYCEPNGLPDTNVNCLLEDLQGRIWGGTRLGGLCRFVSDPSPSSFSVARNYTLKDGLPTLWISQLFQASDGSLWAASARGLISVIPVAGGKEFRFRVFAESQGLTSWGVQALAEDRSGNMWLGMNSGGAIKFARSGITAFTGPDGFQWASCIFKDRAGDLFVIGGPSPHEYLINRFDGERFAPIRIDFLRDYQTWGWNQVVLNDHEGEWWLATIRGLFRFPKTANPSQLARAAPKAIYTVREGLADNLILRLFEDSRGDVWISSTGERHGLARWERATNTFYHYGEPDGLPSLTDYYPTALCEDGAGNVWVGFSTGGGLVRYRAGRFTPVIAADGLPEGGIFNLFVDSLGRLWAPTTRGGVCRIDNPIQDHPTGRVYTTANGVSSNDIKCVAEDKWGRIYFGTGRGIDRLDPASGRIRHYTTADGALLGDIYAAARDRDGTLWFGFATGPVRLVPEPDSPQLPPPILITGLRVAGDPYPVSALGESQMGPLVIGPNRNHLQVDFVALGFGTGEDLRYQYKLEGASDDWSPLAAQRTLNFANLAPGSYRLLVRAMAADGAFSETPASLSFKILPPAWRSWWFIAIITAFSALVAYRLYRYRIRRLLELERVRTRIAADLHDDIGSSLSQISVLSEVLRTQLGDQEARISKNISLINRVSQEALDSMSDIVWAINPQQDHLSDLVRRMRRIASEMLPARGIEFVFNSTAGHDLKLGADIRRQVFLMFKEAVNNLVRHSRCTRAEIDLNLDGRWLALVVADNGEGFDPDRVSEGNGLVSLRRRARSLGGEAMVSSIEDKGTTVTIKVPHRHPLDFRP